MISLPLTLYDLWRCRDLIGHSPCRVSSPPPAANSAADLSVMGATQLGVADPPISGSPLILVLVCHQSALVLRRRFREWDPGFGQALKALTLPTIALALPQAPRSSPVSMRSSLIEHAGRGFHAAPRAQRGLRRSQAPVAARAAQCDDPGVSTIIGLPFSFLGSPDGMITKKRVLTCPASGGPSVPGDNPARTYRAARVDDPAGLWPSSAGDLPRRSRLCSRRPAAQKEAPRAIAPPPNARSCANGAGPPGLVIGCALSSFFIALALIFLPLDAVRNPPKPLPLPTKTPDPVR